MPETYLLPMKPDKTFAGAYTVRVGDINYGGHMGNDKALLLFHDARLYFLGKYDFSESDEAHEAILRMLGMSENAIEAGRKKEKKSSGRPRPTRPELRQRPTR